ncbi:centrosomal protein of 152 kDa [Spea bombifrons]|uniref:centrosomal protein of 152 kDa n=1 Tax=Spea bombifrons TaxID=233779 RepID=UPI002349DA02|nr:centrosomal protein of 152 kDa [Spea bombifrons]
MSIDFDSGALQTQHDDDDEEYDKEDYAREQELQQLLTDLPHDLLDDSLSSSPEPNYSDCSGHEISEQNPHWRPDTSWGPAEEIPNPQKLPYSNVYPANQYCSDYVGKQGGDQIPNGWHTHNDDDDEETMYGEKYNYSKGCANDQSAGEDCHTENRFDAPDPCSNSDLYHLPEDFKPYTNGQQGESFPDHNKEAFQRFVTPEGINNQPTESIQVSYNPYQLNVTRKDLLKLDPGRRDDRFDDLQREFLDTGESSAANMQYVQLQVLYKARGRQLQELSEKLEESQQQIRYLNHQLAIIKDEKDGLAISLQESQTLIQNGKEMEVQLKGQMTALEKTVESLTLNDDQLRKELKVAKVAMESMQQQVLDMCRSDSIQRARDQHEAVVSVLTKKHEEQVFSLQQKLDNVNAALLQQKELCSRLETQVKQAERKQEESKLEKTEIINRLSRSLEESQKQCANLLQTGSLQEATQLRLQLQQIQSSKAISDGMNKALQDEIIELKEQITMYESAANMGVFINSVEQEELSDSYVDLGIKKVNWQKSRFHRVMHNNGTKKDLTGDGTINELKSELERCLNSNKSKRQQIIQLQSDLKTCHLKTEELEKSLARAEKKARDCEIRTGSLEKQFDPEFPYGQASSEALKEEIQKLQNEKQLLQQEVEKHLLCIKGLRENEEKMKMANQELCNEMRGMIQDFDRDKQEAIQRCERTYEQHHEDIKKHLEVELSEGFSLEKQQLCQHYEERISQLQAQINDMTLEMTAVQECYIAVCKEKDTLEDTIRENLKRDLQVNEEKLRDRILKESEKSLETLKTELEDKYQSTLSEAKAQWQSEKEIELKQRVEAQMVLSKENWSKEQQQITEKTVQDVENQWRQKLDKALEDIKAKVVQDLDNQAVQTDEILNGDLTAELKSKLQDAFQDKERAVREVRRELEMQHREDIAKQVELALTKARTRWVHEMTSLSEYKANVKLEYEKWEKQKELDVKKQISEAITSAEENWRIRGDNDNLKQKEFEEKMTLMERELEQKSKEYQVMLNAELAKAHAQWDKEKHEDIQKIQAKNEAHYRAFLDTHQTKINEVLLSAKEDYEKQNNKLVAQKEAEMTDRLNQSFKKWSSEATQRLRDQEANILSETDLILGEIHDELVEKRVNERFSVSSTLDSKFLEKLRSCLQKAIKDIVSKVLTKAKLEWIQTNREHNVAPSEQERSSAENKSNQRMTKSHLERLSNGSSHTLANVERKEDSHEYKCCELCSRQIDKSKKECYELRSKLDKACRHLQHAVKEHKLKAEQFKENEANMKKLRQEKDELLEEIKSIQIQKSLPPEGGSENSCAFCRGNALEEMRAQYIKAVDKIKNDMLRYIHESKVRAAELLKSEVLRERQETARKMRKYYLTCLQQLLKDDGKNEGAEKKIMNAASKLATMAKVLETPISQKCQSKNLRTALEQEKDDSLKSVQGWTNHRRKDQHIEQNTMNELIKKHAREKTSGGDVNDAEEPPATKNDNASRKLDMDHPDPKNLHMGVLHSVASPFPNQTSSEKAHVFSCSDSKAQCVQGTYHGHGEPSFLQDVKDYRFCDEPKTKLDKQRFDLQETPVRDENASNEWSCVSSKGPIPSQSAQCSLNSFNVPPHISNTLENFTASGLCSLVQGIHDPVGREYEGQHYSARTVKRKDQNPGTQHSINVGLHLPSVENCPESKLYLDVGRGSKLLSRKLLKNFASPQQDSGFDSPFTNFDSFNE